MTDPRRTTLVPQQARTEDALCALKRDHVSYGDYWTIINEANITFSRQKVGEAVTGTVTLPRYVFDRFVRWYTTGNADMRQR